ncbi:hypothetical protein PJH51_16330 [Mycobacterium kansasii]
MNGPRNPGLYCAQLAATTVFRGQVPPWLAEHIEQCKTTPTSAAGHQNTTQTGELEHELIDAAEASRILGLSERQVRRRHADFDGQLKSGVWLFPRRTVTEYAEWRASNAG